VARHACREKPARVAGGAWRGLRDLLLYSYAKRYDFKWRLRARIRKDFGGMENRRNHGLRITTGRRAAVQIEILPASIIMRSRKVSLHSVLRAFDEAEFGPKNTLNLRESLPSAADARYRTEGWLRERQISRAKEVLVITGRGNQSPGGISPVREAILALLPSLRRRGVVTEWREHSAGSLVVKLGSISSLLEAPRRKRDRETRAKPTSPHSLQQLDATTVELLRRLAVRSLEELGMRELEKFVETEMLSKFQSLAESIDDGEDAESRLREAIKAALDQLDD
jgi:hypothetical protein